MYLIAATKKVIPDSLKMIGRKLLIRKGIRSGVPSTIGFEMTTFCNSQCIMCVRRDTPKIEHKHLDQAIVIQVVNEIKKIGGNVRFTLAGVGEPLLYPKLIETVELIKREIPSSYIKIITNGIALDANKSGEIIDSGVDHLMVSLNTGSRETYKWLCGVDKFEQVRENILVFIEEREKRSTHLPYLHIDLKLTGRTEKEIPIIRQWLSEVLLPTDNVTILKYREKPTGLEYHQKFPYRYPCLALWTTTKIDIDGNVYPCDGKVLHYEYRKNSELLLGNIGQESLSGIYNSAKIHRIRQIHLKGNYDKLETCADCPAFSITPNCWFWNPVPVKRRWL